MPETRCRAALTSARVWAAIVAVALSTLACGSTDNAAAGSPSPSQATSPSHSPPAGGKTFSFKISPVGTATSKGTITVTAGAKTTTVELKITGMQANTSHVSHIHVGSCAARGGIAFALNQVVADGQGDADTRTTLDVTYPPASGRWYVVVHSGPDMQGASASYLLCGNLF